jgi:hypothetical protein
VTNRHNDPPLGPAFTLTFSAQAITVAMDYFELVAPTNKKLAIIEMRLGQYSDFGDAQAELLSIQCIRGYTSAGSGGSTPTPIKWDPTSSRVSLATVKMNNTTLASTGTADIPISDAWNVQASAWLAPPRGMPLIVAPSQRFVLRGTAPADSLTMNGTILWEERDIYVS